MAIVTRIFVLALALLALPALAQAQTHPCDVTDASTTPTKGTKASWCASDKDEEGIPNGSWGFVLLVDSVRVLTYANAVPANPSPSPTTGRYYFELLLPSAVQIGRGNHVVQVLQFNATGESPLSNDAVWQIGGKPTKPNQKTPK